MSAAVDALIANLRQFRSSDTNEPVKCDYDTLIAALQQLDGGPASFSTLAITGNGAASAPPLSVTGTWFTGGSATTTKPQVLIEPAGTTSNAWSTSGTGLGINAAAGFAGRLIDAQVNGVSAFNVTSSITIAAGNFRLGGTSSIQFSTNRSVIFSSANGNLVLSNFAQTDFDRLQFGGITNAFPAWKRSTTSFIARLADDSADTGVTMSALTVSSGAQLIISTAAFTNNAAAAAGTLLNSPTAGDPTKWIPINDNGTIRNIPAW